MTKEFEAELKKLQYVSMADFCNRIDEIKDINDKLAFATEYLLSFKENVDCSLTEAIDIARMKIADGIAEYYKMKEKAERAIISKEAFPEDDIKEVDLKPYGNVENNNNLYFFMAKPANYLQLVGSQRLNKLEDKDTVFGDELKKEKVYQNTVNTLNKFHIDLNFTEKQRNYLHIDARLEAKFGSTQRLEDAFMATKPSFFAKLFRTTSNEAKNLDVAYMGFKDQNSPLYGQKDALENAANAYLQHIYPGFKPGYPLVDDHLINQLSGTQKTRVIFCKAILESLRSEEKMKDDYNEAINNNEAEFTFENNNEPVKKQNIIDLDKDLDDSFENNNDSMELSNNNENEIENNMD